VLDTFVGALAVRRSLPRRIEAGLEYAVAPHAPELDEPRPNALGQRENRKPFRWGQPLCVISDPYL